METMIVEVCLGVLDEIVQFILPAHVPIGTLKENMIRQIKLVYWNVDYDENTKLYSQDSQQILAEECTLSQCGIHEGSVITLI